MPEPTFHALRALWLDRNTIALPAADTEPDVRYQLQFTQGTRAIELTPTQPGKYLYLAGYSFFLLAEAIQPDLLKGAISIAALGSDYSTGVQPGGVLDDLFAYDGKLGVQFGNEAYENISVTLWAPTAESVKLLLYREPDDAEPADTLLMLESNGVWSAEIENSWRGHYYLFHVRVYVPALQQFFDDIVTDPYSNDLALNGIKSRLTDLNDPLTKPENWDEHNSPELPSNNDLSIWELHVRDFSIADGTVSAEQRGGYLAFTAQNSNGMQHLRRLAEAGLKAVHLLPTFHIGSINENKSLWQSPGPLAGYPPDGTQQQAEVVAVQDFDGYNWGYDPVHYMAPEGSYAFDPYERVKEYRSMVQALHNTGLRVIQDQVFNHTHSNGQDRDSVLDKIVPSYYYRLDQDGRVLSKTCCSDTASERRMMEKLMIDCLVQNVRHYKIDGFRFDLMGYHYVSNMRRIKAALPDHIYLYGEGWNAAETANNPNMPNATQLNMYGLGIGTFNDRIRDGVRGGNPFADPSTPGFVTGSYTNSDWIRAGLAGNLQNFTFTGSDNKLIMAGALKYYGAPVGYTASTIECVNFCGVHDNRILFDAIQMKSPATDSTAIRAKRQVLALSIIALAQGIPFFHAGDELLRSKNMDENSYNSGDWFNKLDFTGETNHWGTGLPPAADNESEWPIMQPLLANEALTPSHTDIFQTRKAFEALLRVRYSSGLFRMQTIEEVQQNLSFLDTGDSVIAMKLKANVGAYSGYQNLLVVFNARDNEITLKDKSLKSIHPALPHCGEFDAETGLANIPALTAAVFV